MRKLLGQLNKPLAPDTKSRHGYLLMWSSKLRSQKKEGRADILIRILSKQSLSYKMFTKFV